MTATFHVGDAIEVMNKLPEKSVDLVLTSPPFLALRSYLPSDHPDKALEGGSQSTPGEFIDWLLDVVEACDRVLAPHGSLCLELGDTYAGSGQGRNWGLSEAWADKYGTKWASDDDLPKPKVDWNDASWPLPKSLSLIPESFRFAMVYGRNPHTGRTTEPWRLRNVIRWVRPNPPVGALGDKFRPATSELMVFCKSAKRYFDLDAVREPYSERFERGIEKGEKRGSLVGAPDEYAMKNFPKGMSTDHAGAPPLDWWNIPPGGYEGAHYAVWPPELCVKPVKAMCPEKVCRQCGEPSRRIVEAGPEYAALLGSSWADRDEARTKAATRERNSHSGQPVGGGLKAADYRTTGFSDCGHNDWRPGLVLDCFGGSGTTAAVATGHGRDCILIDLDERNVELARQRIGPMFFDGPYRFPTEPPSPELPVGVQTLADAPLDDPLGI